MVMIPLLHVLEHGGVLNASGVLSANYCTAWFLNIAAYCAVNTYGLISGYVGYEKKHGWTNFFMLLFQVSFYTILTTVFFAILSPEKINLKIILAAIIPFAYGSYWYYTAYFCLFFVMPYLDIFIKKATRTESRKMLISCFCVFSLLTTFFNRDIGNTVNGYSVLWLSILYLLGAYIKKYDIKVGGYAKAILGYLVCVLITWCSKLLIEFSTDVVFGVPKNGNYLIQYTSPTIVMCSVLLLLCFKELRFTQGCKKAISFFAPAAFGVYLFHREPLIWDFIDNAFAPFASYSTVGMLLATLITALLIWLIGSLIDKMRIQLFFVLKIKQCCENIDRRIINNKWIQLLENN